ncbi:MAG TPA: molybdenum cofactor biosynthesis protein MoaE [Bryobacterales bacterium]|nr:molybdenum cofactor biosynthesis protein MoaE [Bryobacterales bacterium]
MFVKVLFFGMLKDLVGRSEERLQVEAGTRLGGVFEHYARLFPKLQEMSHSIVLAQNQQFAAPETVIGEGDEIALLPPVSGGSGEPAASEPLAEVEDELGNYFAITRVPIDVRVLGARLARGRDGAVITFEGVVRDNSKGRTTLYLEYDCYVPLAIKMMREIAASLLAAHPVDRIGMIHRLGRMEIGDTSVAIVVTSAHRQPAYEASRDAIDRLKRLVPIWKKEYFADGGVWVEGEWDASVPRLEASAPQSRRQS